MNIIDDLLSFNPKSRSGHKLAEVQAIVVHYTACPRATAKNIRDYFERAGRYASAHYVVGLEGEILHCIPDNEVGWHCGSKTYTELKRDRLGSGNPNYCTIGIECCHPNDSGKFSVATLESLENLLSYLCLKQRLDPETQIMTHEQIVGWKRCPLWFSLYPAKFIALKSKVSARLK